MIIIDMVFIAKIKAESLNDIECYKISINKEWQIFINKDDSYILDISSKERG